ncbi:putative bi-functional transferase/deacetylase [Streptomyces lividans 1326]|uniref:Putative bi-functional transferase/deacetylase n=2 Tax=Streptomyces lividans TaxID=1916 RepID=A0A7U9DQ05_STRLI|nr:putative bi-functional transferase/deacetylase [Streptomyces lividans 1326]
MLLRADSGHRKRGPEASDGPVFVDASGRRSRLYRRLGILVGIACAVYAVVIVSTLLSGNSDAPWMPVPGQEEGAPAGQVDTTPAPSQSAQPSGTGNATTPQATPSADAGVTTEPGVEAPASGTSGVPGGSTGQPGTSAGPESSAAGSGQNPGGSGATGPDPTQSTEVPPSTGTDPSAPTGGGAPSGDPTQPTGGSTTDTDPGAGGTNANGAGAPDPVAGPAGASVVVAEPAAGSSTPPSLPLSPGEHPLMASSTRRHGAARSAREGSRRRLPLRLLLPLLVLVALVAMLMLRGYVHSEILADHRVQPPAATDKVPQKILEGGPVIDVRGGRTESLSVPDHRLVLTFDDGPDPTWTPRVLDVLKKHDAHAVFFVTGTMASRYPDLVERMVDEGHEVGLHTFNHPDLSFQSEKRIDWELSQNQLAITGAAGVRTSLFRPPYSSFADAMDNKSWPVTEYIGGRGYLVVVNNTDSEDWKKPGVDEIIRRATPKGGKGAIVLMHDSGGDRHQTVQALDRFLPDLKKKGYEFDNLTEALDAPGAMSPVAGAELWKGRAWVFLVQASEKLTDGLVVGLAVIGTLVIGRFVLMLLLSGVHARRVRRRRFRWGPAVTEPVTVLVPAYNEAKCIENTVRSLVASDHPVEVIVIDDGSSDGTARIVEGLGLPGVRVIRQLNAGKPAALNRGLANARYDIVVMMDGDTVFEPSTVRELVQPFGDPRVGAVAGNAKVGNKDSLIGAWQHIEYVMGFNLDRRMYDVLGCMPTIPGAVGAFRRSALEPIGGMSDDTLAEDTDVTMALHRAGWRVGYAENARAWTEAPESVGQLWSQRYRWSYGTMQAIWKHRRAVIEKGPSGRFGRVGLPFVSLFMVLAPLLAPLIDVFLLYGLVFGPTEKTIVAWLGVLAIQAVCAAYAFRLDREKLTPLISLPLQQILYRQIMYVVLLQSWITALTGGRLRWQKLRRSGGVSAPPPGADGVPPQRRSGAMDGRPVG